MRLSTTLGPWPNEDARYSVSLCPCRWRHRLCRHVEPARAGALLCAYVERLVGMDAMERWFVLLAVAGLLGFGATVAWVLAQA